MKRLIVFACAGVVAVSLTGFVSMNSTGIAGKTGAPGEQTCAGGGCHFGGSSAAKGITITATPSFSLDQYKPDTVYNISITVGAAGFSRFGFDCEILDSVLNNAGTMQSVGPGVKFLNFGARRNATHNTPKAGAGGSATFTFNWKAPNIEKATIYVCGNAVNLNGTTSGDLPIPSSLQLTRVPPPPPDTTQTDTSTVGIARQTAKHSMRIFPNPANSTLFIECPSAFDGPVCLMTVDGKVIKEGHAVGSFVNFSMDVRDVPRGVYFVRIGRADEPISQKLVVLR